MLRTHQVRGVSFVFKILAAYLSICSVFFHLKEKLPHCLVQYVDLDRRIDMGIFYCFGCRVSSLVSVF
jgi:hypothetical protein